MTSESDARRFSDEQSELWDRVVELWSLAQAGTTAQIESCLDPEYVGWDTNTPLPHGRMEAVKSVSGESQRLMGYDLHPHSVRVYKDDTGVVHYSYTATVGQGNATGIQVSGKWTEVYVREDGQWRMIAVSGRPDQLRKT